MTCGKMYSRIGSARTRLQGEAGNHRVASELMLLGLNVWFPGVDQGVDLLVDGGVRVQVKSAHISNHKGLTTECSVQYSFWLARGPHALGGGRSTETTTRKFSKFCDFVVLFGIEQNRFWIVPAALLDDRFSVTLGRSMYWIDADLSKMKQLQETGMTCEEIGKEMGISMNTVSRRLRGMFLEPGDVKARIHKINLCEGRWDLIVSAVASITEAESILPDIKFQETQVVS